MRTFTLAIILGTLAILGSMKANAEINEDNAISVKCPSGYIWKCINNVCDCVKKKPPENN